MNEFTEEDYSEILTEMYLQMAENTVKAMERTGVNTTSDHIFTYLLSDTVLLKIADYTTEVLVMNSHPPLSLHEFKQFIGTRWLRSRYRVSTENVFLLMKYVAMKNGFALMELQRFNSIYVSIRGFPVQQRSSEDSNQKS